MSETTTRRATLKTIGVTAGAALLGGISHPRAARPAELSASLPEGASTLRHLTQHLADAPRRRSFKTVPMILERPQQWDDEALAEVIAYRGGPRQVWDNTELAGPWLNLMRNALNAQIWSFKHPDFLVVSATHGTAHLALFDQAMWDKYELARLTGGKFASNAFINERAGATADATDQEILRGVLSPHDTSIPVLQRRGAVFLGCHNSIWETAQKLIDAGTNPDKLSLEALAAELTNHVLPGVIVTPGAVATLVELQQSGFHYAK
ncbi:transcriptional initiation protein Tat [Burkholderia vietnamiensis]|jgi:hypothetical protein|uniref:Transcriptional initiation protein Tat n=2 Tax=Pseudomonadota TaxID=1224 RepID=A0A6P2QFI9_9BURK|nr:MULTISPECIES: hypothetical protein [Burkholderia]TPQ42264.1 transcriptional initiation protein Tat [Burkholderia ubonensis]AJY04094.1 hypothetical protein AK36_3911 [Burkholderia vietnamiensis LMG 10929]AOJ15866.1 transcriptional initiation protein Tat [Burkholderia vietnamiensis]AVR12397.1 transcriptional initiation protein Tat [Burkholderia vietnamiensis]AXK68064.1 transcriptional initiation protein Tat [Burkholderia sp. IDO3]